MVVKDSCTASNFQRWTTVHTAVRAQIEFGEKILRGSVSLRLRRSSSQRSDEPEEPGDDNQVILDTSFVDVEDVSYRSRPCKWRINDRTGPLGSPLIIQLPAEVEKSTQEVQLDILFKTTSQCTALGWLDPAQSGTDQPYMYSQCQAIHARSIFPCQDTPLIKSTYDFEITSRLPVLASGLAQGSESCAAGRIYRFRQDVPIPSYLFAIASGDIASASIGPRSTIWTSPGLLAAAKWEFEESTENYIQALEKIVYPYQWGEYNLLVLPPSFPYGGMENPIYTYVTPTTISGDRENTDVIAHELSHSYSGNLVTAATWQDFWLNEGWTTYLERRLQAVLFGENHRDFSAIIGWKSLCDAVKDFGADHEFTKLIPQLDGCDPDDAFSRVPYEKGYIFLTFLENTVGKLKWNKYIPHYFGKFARKSLTSVQFKEDLISFFDDDNEASSALKHIDWDTWFFAPGLPPKPKFDTSLVDICYELAERWRNVDTFMPSLKDIKGWKANQIVVFLDTIESFSPPLSAKHIQDMGSVYGFPQSRNVEVLSRFLSIGLQSRLTDVYRPTAGLLGQVGRMKFVRPLYKHLNAADRTLALQTFNNNRNFYHPICRTQVEKDLGLA